MLKALIVDDSIPARKNIINMIDWNSAGFEIAGEASNGQDALVYLSNNHADLVITDIYMPNMNGTELVKLIHRMYPNIAILVVSSYNDFSDVKETLTNGALDYLLKHNLNAEVLRNALNKVKTLFEGNNISVSVETPLLDNSFGKNEYIKQVLLSSHNTNLSNASINTYNLNYNAMMVFEINNFHKLTDIYTGDYIHNTISKIIDISVDCFSSTPDKQNDIIYLEMGRFVLLIKNSSVNIKSIINTYFMRISNSINEFLNLKCTCGISIIPENASLKNCYDNCIEEINEKKLTEQIEGNKKKEIYTLTLKQEKELIDAFDKMDKTAVIDLCKKLITESNVSLTSAKMLAGEIISILFKVSDHFSVTLYEIMEKEGVTTDNLKSANSVIQIYSFIVKIIERLFKDTDFSTKNKYSSKITPAVKFIEENYADDISPSYVADSVGFSHNWLNELFNQEIGMNINSYITKVRIEAACDMINSGESNLQLVADKCGFNYYSYFSKIFKKEVGMTPIQYAKQK